MGFKTKIMAPTKVFSLRRKKSNPTLMRNEGKLLARKFKLKKKIAKKKMLRKVKEEPSVSTSSTLVVADKIKIEIDDVLKDQSILSSCGYEDSPIDVDSADSTAGSGLTCDDVGGELSEEKCKSSMFTIGDDSVDEENAEEEEDNELRCWRYRDSDNLQILFLAKKQVIALKGSCTLKCVYGRMVVNGKVVNPKHNSVDVLSEDGSSLLCVEDVSSSVTDLDKKTIKSILSKLKESTLALTQATEKEFIRFMEAIDGPISTCVLIKKTFPPLHAVLKQLNDYRPTKNVQLYTKPYPYPILKTQTWKETMKNAHMQREKYTAGCVCSMMICGGKDVGKSSFARYAINSLLNRHDTVFYLECDCGQTEFTPPGVVSLIKVNKPLLGPPFTHHSKPVRSVFYGHISPKDTPSDYISIIQSLFNTYLNEVSSNGPLVINQQGWVKGLGLSLLIDCIRIINPCVIIQMNSEQESRNIPQSLDGEFIRNQPGWSIMNTHQSARRRTHEQKYITIDSQVLPKNPQKSKGLVTRNLSVTSYFSDLFIQNTNKKDEEGEEHYIPPSLASIQPYAIRFSDIALHVVHENVTRDHLLYALNQSVVCLSQVSEDRIVNAHNGPCYLGDQPDFFEFFGLGIVRNIDPINEILYLLTPEPFEVLQNVNVLVKGNVQMPQTYLTQDKTGSHSYFCYDYDACIAKGSAAMKPRFNLKRKPSRLRNSFGER